MNKLGDSSRLILVPSGLGISLSEYLRSTPVIGGDVDIGGDTNIGGGENVNDGLRNTDPELYEILEMSRRAYEEELKNTGTNPETNPETNPDTELSDLPPLDNDGDYHTLEDDMDEAIRLSLQTDSGPDDMNIDNPEQNNPPTITPPEVQNNPPPNSLNQPSGDIDTSNLGSEFFSDILSELEGVDINDPSVQSLISNLSKNEKKEDKKDS